MKSLSANSLTAGLLAACLLHVIAARGQQAGFTYTALPASQCAPVTLSFSNTTTGQPLAYSWDFGDGRTSQAAQPQITYRQPGRYRITLTANYANGSSQAWQEVRINNLPTPAFEVDVTTACQPFTARFTDLTPGAVSRTWDFGDGSAPVTTAGAGIQHAYTRAGSFDVTLTVTNAAGCTQTLTRQALVTIAAPQVTLSSPRPQGCVPLTAAFTAQAGVVNNDPVAGYAWSFGDGGTLTTTTANATHEYAQTGTFDVTVTVTTRQGCTASYTAGRLVRTGNPPVNVSFTATPGLTCAGAPVRLLATAGHADSYSWDFGDGATQEGPEHDITHAFQQNGLLAVQLKAGMNGCYTAAPPVAVQVTGPAAAFHYRRSCNDRNAFIFTNTSSAPAGVTYEWDFNDGSPAAYTQHAAHVYAQPGHYTVRLTVRDAAGNCISNAFRELDCFRADFNTGVSAICRGSSAGYGVLNIPAQLVDHYSWRFGDGDVLNTTATDVQKVFAQSGAYSDTLIVIYKDPSIYCNDTVIKRDHLTIMSPVAGFDVTGPACANQPVSFSNTSQPWPNIPLTGWQWQLGNGDAAGTQTPPPAVYTASGAYTVKLVVTDARNCMDSLTRDIVINPTPYVYVTASQYRICEGNNITLNAGSDGTVQWSPYSQISCVQCNNPSVSPVVNTRYYATATNVYGCTATDSLDIQVIPQVRLSVRPDTALCQGGSVQLTASGARFYSWSPAAYLTAGNVADPISTPAQDITYTVTGSNDVGCPSESRQVSIQVKPLPTVNAGLNQLVTAGAVVQLNAVSSPDVVSWQWTPADYLECAVCPATRAAVRKPITYRITAANAAGCTKTDVVEIELVCRHQEMIFIPSAFSPNGDGENDIFYPRGKGVNFIKTFRIFNRWGQEVFRRERFSIDDSNAGWNGSYKGQPQPPDVYIYFIEAYCDTNELFELKGNVTLLR